MDDHAINASLSPAAEAPPPPPERAPETVDPRIRRTRELLQQSLGDLLAAKDFDRISVHEITDAAGVNRATFYAHYNDKFALLECMVATRFHALLDERGIVVAGGCTNALQGLVIGLCDFMTRSTCPDHAPGSRTLQPHMETALVSVLRGMIFDGMFSHAPAGGSRGLQAPESQPRHRGASAPEIGHGDNAAIRSAAIAWAIYGATREALGTPGHDTAEAIAATVVTLIEPLFAPALQSLSS